MLGKSPLEAGDAAPLPRLAFVHVPKTAGTSVTSTLEGLYGSATFPAMTTLDYVLYPDAALETYRFYKGHAYRRDYERLPPGTVRFTVLRDPVARALSYFAYYRALDDRHISDGFVLEASRLAKTQSAIEFIHSDSPFVIEHVRLGQVRQFLSAETLARVGHRQTLTRELRQHVVQEFACEIDRFDYVLTNEGLTLSYPLMAARLGLPRHAWQLPRHNVSVTKPEADIVDVRRAVVDVNGAEFACYEHVRSREQAWIAEGYEPLLSQLA